MGVKARFRGDCDDFPCDDLHPCRDQAKPWHNTKVFNLCLIKKVGLESWARDKAKSVQQVYLYEKWNRLVQNDDMQGAQISRNESYIEYVAVTRDEGQRSRSRFSTAC